MSSHATAPTAVVWTPGVAHPCVGTDHPLWTELLRRRRPEPSLSPGPTLPVKRLTHCRSSDPSRSGLALADVPSEQTTGA
jgi:hypothetical protein